MSPEKRAGLNNILSILSNLPNLSILSNDINSRIKQAAALIPKRCHEPLAILKG